MTAANSSHNSASRVAKWCAILGTAVQCSLLVGMAFFVAGTLKTFQEITAGGISDPKLMAQGIGEASIPVVIALGVGVWGTFISLVTAIVSNYRSRWFFWWSSVFAVVYMIVLPLGTALGLAFLIFLIARRREFRPRAEEV
jgi:biopolymer transport protein ExbB/TolQ